MTQDSECSSNVPYGLGITEIVDAQTSHPHEMEIEQSTSSGTSLEAHLQLTTPASLTSNMSHLVGVSWDIYKSCFQISLAAKESSIYITSLQTLTDEKLYSHLVTKGKKTLVQSFYGKKGVYLKQIATKGIFTVF